jgi:hypothetical protein
MGRTAYTEPQCLYSRAIPPLPMGRKAYTEPQYLYFRKCVFGTEDGGTCVETRRPVTITCYSVSVNVVVRQYYLLLFLTYALQSLRFIVRSWLDVPTFATRRLHACHHARAPSGGTWNCGREMSGNFA